MRRVEWFICICSALDVEAIPLFSLPESRMDYLLDEDIEMELLSAIAFEDDIMDDNTTTIPESQPPNTEAATSSMEVANPTEVSASPNEAGRSFCMYLTSFCMI